LQENKNRNKKIFLIKKNLNKKLKNIKLIRKSNQIKLILLNEAYLSFKLLF